jgi:hypothetical protein
MRLIAARILWMGRLRDTVGNLNEKNLSPKAEEILKADERYQYLRETTQHTVHPSIAEGFYIRNMTRAA